MDMDMDDLMHNLPPEVAAELLNSISLNSSESNFSDFGWNITIPPYKPDDQQYQKDLLLYYIMGIGGMTVCCLGIIGNILSVVVLCQRVMRSSTYSYLCALAISDLLCLLLTVLLLIKDTKKPVKYKMTWDEPYYVYMFPVIHPAAITFQVTSIWLTLAFTVDRYIMICHPFKAERWCSVSRARKVIVSLFVAGILFNIPRFCEYEVEQVPRIPELPSLPTVAIKLTEFGKTKEFREVNHSWLYLICVAGIPFLALCVLNTFLIIAVHKSRQKGLQLNAKEKRRNDTTVMLIGVVIIFLICQGPALISRMDYALYFDASFRSMSWHTFNEISNLLVIVNSAINIVPYYFFGKKFRRQFWRLFCACVLSKEEIRRLARSLSITMDRRASNISTMPCQEMNHVNTINHRKTHKNSIAVPLIQNVQSSSLEELSIQSCRKSDSSSVCSSNHKLMVNLEANGNCGSKVDTALTCEKCHNNNAIL